VKIKQINIMKHSIQIATIIFLLLTFNSIKAQTPDEYYSQGNELLASKDYNGAILCYTKAIKLNNDFCNAYINRGVCYYYQEDYATAIENYKAALSIDPSSTIAKDNLKSAKQSLSAQRWQKAAAILGAIGQGASAISNTTVPNNSSSSSDRPSPNSSSSVSNQKGSTLQLKRKICTMCNGTGHIDSEISAYGSLEQKWCPECHKNMSPTHCHGCKTCPACSGKKYTESYSY
jgi:tetratricopeptide (TPR) repeat protein